MKIQDGANDIEGLYNALKRMFPSIPDVSLSEIKKQMKDPNSNLRQAIKIGISAQLGNPLLASMILPQIDRVINGFVERVVNDDVPVSDAEEKIPNEEKIPIEEESPIVSGIKKLLKAGSVVGALNLLRSRVPRYKGESDMKLIKILTGGGAVLAKLYNDISGGFQRYANQPADEDDDEEVKLRRPGYIPRDRRPIDIEAQREGQIERRQNIPPLTRRVVGGAVVLGAGAVGLASRGKAP
jgi:hypothetical protein